MDCAQKINTIRGGEFVILDIIFFAFIAVFAVLGFIFGFFRTLTSFFGWAISLLLSYLLAKAIANAILLEPIAKFLVGDGLYDTIYGIMPQGLKEISMNSIRAAIGDNQSMEQIRKLIESQSKGIMVFAASLIQDAVTKEIYLSSVLANVGQVYALELTYHVYVILIGVIFFIVLRIIIMGVSLIFKFRLRRGTKLWERVAGIALGAVRGFVYACFLLVVASYVSGILPMVKDQTDESKVSVPVTTWISEATGKMLSGDLETNEHYMLMIDALEQHIAADSQPASYELSFD